MEALTIGQLARQAGVGVETVRFYEREGLLAEPPRRRSGYRQYPTDVVTRLRFVRQAKELGFSLREIKELLGLRFDPTTTCAEVRKCAEAKLADIETRIEALQRMKKALQTITSACPGEGPIEECPILAAIDSDKAELPTTEARTSKSETSGRARERGARARASVRSRR